MSNGRAINLPIGREGRILALGLAVAVLLMLWYGAARPLFQLYAARDYQITNDTDTANRLTQIIADLPRLQMRLNALSQAGGAKAAFLSGTSDAVAAAALEAELKHLVVESGGGFHNAEILLPKAKGMFREIGVRAAFSGDIITLSNVLTGIEINNPPLKLDHLIIHSESEHNEAGHSNAVHSDKIGAITPLSVTVEVFGLRESSATP